MHYFSPLHTHTHTHAVFSCCCLRAHAGVVPGSRAKYLFNYHHTWLDPEATTRQYTFFHAHTQTWMYCTWQNTPTHHHTATYSQRSDDNCGTSHSHCQNTDTHRQWDSEKSRHSCHANMKSTVVCSFPPERKKNWSCELYFPMASTHKQH